MAEAARLAQNRLGGSREGFPRGRSTAQLRFSSPIAPRLMSNATEREARLPDHPVLNLKSCRDGHQRKGIRQAIADFQIAVILGEAVRW